MTITNHFKLIATTTAILSLAIVTTYSGVPLQIKKIEQSIVLNWPAQLGNTYKVQSAPAITGPWTDRASVNADSAQGSWTDPTAATAAQRFYRLVETGAAP